MLDGGFAVSLNIAVSLKLGCNCEACGNCEEEKFKVLALELCPKLGAWLKDLRLPLAADVPPARLLASFLVLPLPAEAESSLRLLSPKPYVVKTGVA